MAPRKKASSQKSSKGKGKATTPKTAIADDKRKVNKSPKKNTKSSLAKWVGKEEEASDSDDNSVTPKGRKVAELLKAAETKTQRRLSGYLRTSKSTTDNKYGEKEEVSERKTTTIIEETTETDDQIVTKVHRETVVDKETITTNPVEAGKKRKHEDDGDSDYTPAPSTTKAIALAGAAEEDEEPWFIQRPRRKARDSAKVILSLHDSVRIANVSSPTPNSSKTFLPATSKKRSRTLTSEKMPLSSQPQSTLTTPTTQPAAL